MDAAAAEDKQFCLQVVDDGSLELSRKHAYYYQVQAQIFLSGRSYCDFVVWTRRGMHIERIFGDDAFWADAVASATHFFNVGILPELIAKHFTSQPKDMRNTIMETDDDTTWCYCREGDSGRMICCDNKLCPIQWFHFDCLELPEDYEVPKSWFCPDCRLLSQSKRKTDKKPRTVKKK